MAVLVGGPHPAESRHLRRFRLLRIRPWYISNSFSRSALFASALLLDRRQQRVQFQRDDAFEFVGQNLSGFGDPFVFSKNQPMSTFDGSNCWLGNSRPPHPDQIDRPYFRVVASASQHERRNVGRHSAAATDKRQLADRCKVVHNAVA